MRFLSSSSSLNPATVICLRFEEHTWLRGIFQLPQDFAHVNLEDPDRGVVDTHLWGVPRHSTRLRHSLGDFQKNPIPKSVSPDPDSSIELTRQPIRGQKSFCCLHTSTPRTSPPSHHCWPCQSVRLCAPVLDGSAGTPRFSTALPATRPHLPVPVRSKTAPNFDQNPPSHHQESGGLASAKPLTRPLKAVLSKFFNPTVCSPMGKMDGFANRGPRSIEARLPSCPRLSMLKWAAKAELMLGCDWSARHLCRTFVFDGPVKDSNVSLPRRCCEDCFVEFSFFWSYLPLL